MLEIQERFKKYFFNNFRKKNDEQIFTSLSLKISPILPKNICDLELHNLTEVWTPFKKASFPLPVVSENVYISVLIFFDLFHRKILK